MSFRLNWTMKQFFNMKDFIVHKSLLKSPWKFYLFIIVKFIPGFYSKSLSLELKNGYIISVKEFMTLYIYKEIFVDGCYDVFSINSECPVVIEIGANTGLFVIRFKSIYPNSEILSFEPFPPNYNSLLETLKINKITGVTPIQKAVADKLGKLKLFIHPRNIGGHSLFQENASAEYVEIEATTLESIVLNNNLLIVDVLKLDCEGAEYSILMSLTKELSKKIRNIIYEPTHKQYSVVELNSYLERLGYDISTHHGLIVASMGKI